MLQVISHVTYRKAKKFWTLQMEEHGFSRKGSFRRDKKSLILSCICDCLVKIQDWRAYDDVEYLRPLQKIDPEIRCPSLTTAGAHTLRIRVITFGEVFVEKTVAFHLQHDDPVQFTTVPSVREAFNGQRVSTFCGDSPTTAPAFWLGPRLQPIGSESSEQISRY